jgi:hypothetical protein
MVIWEVEMSSIWRWVAFCAVFGGLLCLPLDAQAQKPDFSGEWVLDVDKSDDLAMRARAGAGSATQFTRMGVQQLLDRVAQLSRASEEIEIEQTVEDFKVFDLDDNVRIYYIDAKKHPRQTSWGAKLETITAWNKEELIIVTEGKELGRVTEVYTFEGKQLVFVLQLENKEFESKVVARHYYNRKQ